MIPAEPQRLAGRVRDDGDSRAAQIHAGAYNADRDLYSLYRSMLAYGQAISGSWDARVLEPDSDFRELLSSERGGVVPQ